MSIFGRERVAIYIDGSNTYNKLKKIGLPEEGKRFDFSAFVSHIVSDRELISKRYYVGIVRNYDGSQKSEDLVRKQQQFLETLRLSGFEIKKGKIMYDGIGDIREKGVDVKLAVDLVIGAVDNLYDAAIIISSDTDLIPAIKYVRNGKKKKIEYIGFAGSPSFGMIKECSSQRLLAKEDLTPFQYLKEEATDTEMNMVTFFRSLNPQDWSKMATLKWMVKDILSHLIGWDREVTTGLKNLIGNGEEPWFMKTDNYEEFNDKIYNEFKDRSPEDLIAELEKLENTLKEEVRNAGEENLKARGMNWVFDEGGESHFDHHINQIKKAFNK